MAEVLALRLVVFAELPRVTHSVYGLFKFVRSILRLKSLLFET
jgi:hypothetical protein